MGVCGVCPYVCETKEMFWLLYNTSLHPHTKTPFLFRSQTTSASEDIQDNIKSLKNELLSAEVEIKALKEELMQRETVKRRAETNLIVMEKELKSCEAQCDALKAMHHLEMSQVEDSWRKKVEVLQEENAAKKEMANRLTSEKNKLKDEVRQEDELILRVVEQKHAESIAYFKCVCALTVKEKELKSCEA